MNCHPGHKSALQADGSCSQETTAERVVVADDSSIDSIQLPEPTEGHLYHVGYGEPQRVQGSEAPATKRRLKEMLHYMETVVGADPLFDEVKGECQNRHELCAFWAAIDECTVNPSYMKLTCAAACLTCDHLKFETRCPVQENMDDTNIWKPGDLDAMFERIVAQYADKVSVMAQPGGENEMNHKIGDAAWVVVVDDFLTPLECETLIQLGASQGYELSKDVGAKKFDGTYDSLQSNGRTSTNAWCVDDCYQNATTKAVLHKLEELTGIPDANSEYLQLLRYEPGQFYEMHHDYIPHHIDRAQGVRILTAFLYLNDVEEGGGTHFNDMDITCQPKRGRIVLWPSVKDRDPNRRDDRTHHEALPVEKGIKYGANAWFHQRNFKEPYKNNCI